MICGLFETVHFKQRFIKRFLLKGIEYSLLINQVKTKIKEPHYLIKNMKHKGIEGPRYRLILEKKDFKIIIVLEKTNKCFKLITLWPKSSA